MSSIPQLSPFILVCGAIALCVLAKRTVWFLYCWLVIAVAVSMVIIVRFVLPEPAEARWWVKADDLVLPTLFIVVPCCSAITAWIVHDRFAQGLKAAGQRVLRLSLLSLAMASLIWLVTWSKWSLPASAVVAALQAVVVAATVGTICLRIREFLAGRHMG